MCDRPFKRLLALAFSLLSILFTYPATAQEESDKTTHTEKLDPGKIIVEHVTDAHDFHFFTVGDHHYSIPLPVILYQSNGTNKGWHFFFSSAFHHGEKTHNGFQLVNEYYIEKLKEEGVDTKGLMNQQIIAVDAEGRPDTSVKLIDLSMTRNVVQMLIAMIVLILIMTSIAKKYTRNGPKKGPSGFQNAVEPVITFVRDDVAKPNLRHKYQRYMPLLLTIFFFILINNLFGLIPGTANVTGNIALTGVLALISFVVILFSTNKHFWAHMFNPPVPGFVKPILVPVELLGIFTKPFALMIRLFANMLAGHVIILAFIILIFIFGAMNKALGYGTSPLFIALAVFIYVIEVLVAFIQAYIFTTLTAVFIGQSFEHDGHHGHAEDHHGPTAGTLNKHGHEETVVSPI
jgi:F-type H+-transporting ATPase subunit a